MDQVTNLPPNLSIIINNNLYARRIQKEQSIHHFITNFHLYHLNTVVYFEIICDVCGEYCDELKKYIIWEKADENNVYYDESTICQKCVDSINYIIGSVKGGSYILSANNNVMFLWTHNQLICLLKNSYSFCYLDFKLSKKLRLCEICNNNTHNIYQRFVVCNLCVKKIFLCRWHEISFYYMFMSLKLVGDIVYNICVLLLLLKRVKNVKPLRDKGVLKLGWKLK